MSADYMRVLTVKPEVLVYRIPPRPSNRGYRAADWGLDKPSWTGRMRIVTKDNKLSIKLEDKTSGDLFAEAPVLAYPGVAVESVTDSSRYFVLKIVNESGRSAFIGIGFADRGDAFDFNVTLQDHFNSVKKDEEIKRSADSQPALDLQLKEGQTFKINLSGKLGAKSQGKVRTNAAAPSGGIFLPPPPGGLAKPPAAPLQQQQHAAPSTATHDLLGLGINSNQPAQPPQPTNQFVASDWGEFASAQSAPKQSDGQGWVQF